MEVLGKAATETLVKLLSLMDEDHHAKIDNCEGSFIPVIIEVIFDHQKYQQISVAHYYKMNGDLMADPEMLFIHVKENGKFIPCYFKQADLGIEQVSGRLERGEIKIMDLKLQADHTRFANMWFKNIKYQQNL